MAQSKAQIQQWLAQAGSGPRHRFGQNFMIDQNLVRLVAASAEISPGDVLIEVGPGTGTLTEELLASPAARVVAVEIDRDLAPLLRQRWAEEPRFVLIEGDALAGKHELNPELAAAIRDAQETGKGQAAVKLVANLPYQIASPLIIDLLRAGVSMLVFTVQREVADRLRADCDGDAYGPLTVMVQLLAEVEVLRVLPPQAFWPAPKIHSSLVRLRRRDQLGNHAGAFHTFVQQLFSSRRKTLRKALSMAGVEDADAVLERLGINPQNRPETLSPERLLGLFRALAGNDRSPTNPGG